AARDDCAGPRALDGRPAIWMFPSWLLPILVARAGARLVLMVTLRGTGFSPVACNRSPCFSCNRELENQVALAQLRTGHDDPELVRRIRIGAAVQHPVVEA